MQQGTRWNLRLIHSLPSAALLAFFQILKGKTIASRSLINSNPLLSPLTAQDLDDPFNHIAATATTSSPKVEDLYNIFHPTDPISYRLEPLVSKRMAELKPQLIPYTKRGRLGTQLAGLTGLGHRVAQGASSMWSSVASGLATSLLTRSLGYEGDADHQLQVFLLLIPRQHRKAI